MNKKLLWEVLAGRKFKAWIIFFFLPVLLFLCINVHGAGPCVSESTML
jgi:hypothetical protein